ncbi:VWA domain-containing protein [Actinocorallia sp. API 0066]|uniref:VWA domain-containing protein n=1 Tax=Actinocorallia sp. API 0066 TaxID=2896846 RepID=UPI001E5B2981|nr:VWA domain-containing protein [Actinocorallia sp. API 0066]MCD0450062.1 VWA domain-containing protein [Actinocorallia sp. API 0066]
MTFLSPLWLLLLPLVPVMLVAYVLLLRRSRRYAVRFTNLPTLRSVAPGHPAWRKHLLAGMFLTLLTVLVLGAAQPAATVKVPRERATIIVAVDVSLSMQATDVAPSRFEAAKASAKDFIEGLPQRFNVGVVSFAGTASVVASPTTDRVAALNALDNIALDRRTAIGEAVFASITAIKTFDAGNGTDPPPAHIVLLSDGDNTYGRSVASAVAAARTARIPVSTIAFGTPYGTVTIEGETTTVDVNKATLRALAAQTDGHAYEAEDSAELSQVYESIGTSLGWRPENRDITSWFTALAALLALAGGALSLAWYSRLP